LTSGNLSHDRSEPKTRWTQIVCKTPSVAGEATISSWRRSVWAIPDGFKQFPDQATKIPC
jgi:hypothetical protein